MGCSGSMKNFVNSYKYMIIDSDIKNIKDENNSFFYLIMTKSIPKFINIIEESKILKHKNNSTNDTIDNCEKKLKMLFNDYILEENIMICDDYYRCNGISKIENNIINEFIIVTIDFLYLIELQKEHLKYVLIKLDKKDKNKKYIYFSKYDEFLYFRSKRKGIYEFITSDNNPKTISFQNSGNINSINNRSKQNKDYEKILVKRKSNQHKNNQKIQYKQTEFMLNNSQDTINNNDSVIINYNIKEKSILNNYYEKGYICNKEKQNNNNSNGYNIFNNNQSIQMDNINITSNQNNYNNNM